MSTQKKKSVSPQFGEIVYRVLVDSRELSNSTMFSPIFSPSINNKFLLIKFHVLLKVTMAFTLREPWLLSRIVVCICIRIQINFSLPCVCVCFSKIIIIIIFNNNFILYYPKKKQKIIKTNGMGKES